MLVSILFILQILSILLVTETVVWKCSVEKVISQNSQGNTCARVSFLIKLQALGLIH